MYKIKKIYKLNSNDVLVVKCKIKLDLIWWSLRSQYQGVKVDIVSG